jgi:hypothetical protein
MSPATRVVRGICIATAYLTALAVVLGWAAFLIYPIRLVLVKIGAWVLVAPVLLDLTSAWMHVTHILGRTRESGQSGVGLFYYLAYALLGIEAAWWVRLIALAALTLYHLLCHIYVPSVVALRRGWQPEGGALSLFWPLNKLYAGKG